VGIDGHKIMEGGERTFLFIIGSMEWRFLFLDGFTIGLLPKVTQKARSLA
jgi:hypothetical protein